MKTSFSNRFLAAVTAVVIFASALVGVGVNYANASATVPTTPIPSNLAPASFTLFNSRVITANVNSGAVKVGAYSVCGWHYVTDQIPASNGLTIALQASNDGSNWVTYSGSAPVSGNVVDANDTATVNVPPFAWVRASATVTGSNPVTTTFIGFCK